MLIIPVLFLRHRVRCWSRPVSDS